MAKTECRHGAGHTYYRFSHPEFLARAGARVTLVDAWGPGNPRASSSGETRVIRGTYGRNGIYTEMAARSLQLWIQNETRWKRNLFIALACFG